MFKPSSKNIVKQGLKLGHPTGMVPKKPSPTNRPKNT